MPANQDFPYDVFLSHSAKDMPVVLPLAERLRADGLKVWFDEWEIKPGDSIPAKIEEGLEHSRVLVLCMSAHAFGSDWAQLEAGTFRFRDPLNRERRFLPLRLDDAPIKGSLAQFLYINWRPAEREQEYEKLLKACKKISDLAESSAQEEKGWSLVRAGEVSLDRDPRRDYTAKARDTLARRVGMRCSNPACRRLTTGPQRNPNKAFDFGVAAHIAAASVGGPRYIASQTQGERSSIENGIWLCQNCARLVDSDTERYSIELLRTWKCEAENAAALAANPLELSRAGSVTPNSSRQTGDPVVALAPWQMLLVFFVCAILGVVTFKLHFLVAAVFLSLAAAVGLFGFLGGVAHVENRWGKFGGSVAAFVATLLILTQFARPSSDLVDIKGSVYVDGQPATKAVVTLMETIFSDNRREINEGNPGFFEFRGIRGVGDKVKFRIEVDAPYRLQPQIVERTNFLGVLIRIDLAKPGVPPLAIPLPAVEPVKPKPSKDTEGTNRIPSSADLLSDGLRYFSGANGRVDELAAGRLIKKAADMGDAVAKYWLAYFYAQGIGGFPGDFERTTNLLQSVAGEVTKRAKDGDVAAQLAVGIPFIIGFTNDLDPTQIVGFLKTAAEADDSNAMWMLGLALSVRTNSVGSLEQAEYWYERSDQSTNLQGSFELVLCRIEQDVKIGMGFWRRNLEDIEKLARAGNTRAMIDLFINGYRGSREGLPWVQMAATNGNAKAKSILSRAR